MWNSDEMTIEKTYPTLGPKYVIFIPSFLGAFDSIFNSLNDLMNFENGLCGEIKYTPPKTEEAPPPKSPKGKGSAKGKKSPKPKSAGKKGKKSKTPDEDKGPDPVLVAKTERGEKCREEAKEGCRIANENAKRQINHIKNVLEKTISDTKERFEHAFKALFDIIGRYLAKNHKMTTVILVTL